MALINIEYGSLASSDTMNKNFTFLENKISEVSTSTNTVISSILSNIATINSKLAEFADAIQESSKTCQSGISEVRTRARVLFNKMTMVPNWGLCYELTQSEKQSFSATQNGYLLLYPGDDLTGEIKINDIALNKNDNQIVVPIKTGDIMTSSVSLAKAYFLPAAEIAANEI